MSGDLKYHIAKWSGIPGFLDYYNRNRLLVITYHGLYDGLKQPGRYPDTFVHVDDFCAQLKFLKERYNFLAPDDLQECLVTGRPLAQNSALITFDDGYESFERLAWPILRSLSLRTIVFMATDHIETPQPFWFDLVWSFMQINAESKSSRFFSEMDFDREENTEATSSVSAYLKIMKGLKPEKRTVIVREMMKDLEKRGDTLKSELASYQPMSDEKIKDLSKKNVTFGGHTHTHTILTVMTDTMAESEICKNKSLLEDITGKPLTFFAYPNGGSSDFDAQHKNILKRVKYSGAFSLTQKRSIPSDDPMDISRFNVAPEDTVLSLYIRLTGFNRLLKKIRSGMKVI
jgi:peptidoglycan/xylan/chitin deacetylase (PgdA/CDA1 family)